MFINTQGCCFICLTYNSADNDELTDKNDLCNFKISLQNLIQHLNINPGDSITDVGVNLCAACSKIVTQFESLHLQLETVKMKLDYCMGNLHLAVTENQENVKVVQKYSQLMTSDRDSLVQLPFADKLRKELQKRSKNERSSITSSVKLTRVDVAPVKVTKPENVEIFNQNVKEELKDDVNDGWSTFSSDEDQDNNDGDSNISNNLAALPISQDTTELAQPSITIKIIKAETPSPTTTNSISSTPSLSVEKRIVPCRRRDGIKARDKYIFNKTTKLYKCAACDYLYKQRHSATDHYDMNHLPKKCRFCKEGFSSFIQVKEHWEICPKTNSNNHSLKSTKIKQPTHKNAIYSVFVKETGLYACLICNKEFVSREIVCRHYYNIHAEKKFKCDLCNIFSFARANELRRHKISCGLETSLVIQMEKRKNYKIECVICSKKFANKRDLSQHKLTHLSAQYACDQCDKQFKRKKNLNDHVERMHEGRKRKCNLCSQLFFGCYKFYNHQKKCKENHKAAVLKEESVEKS